MAEGSSEEDGQPPEKDERPVFSCSGEVLSSEDIITQNETKVATDVIKRILEGTVNGEDDGLTARAITCHCADHTNVAHCCAVSVDVGAVPTHELKHDAPACEDQDEPAPVESALKVDTGHSGKASPNMTMSPTEEV